jgi:hypothetical protein
MNKILKEIIPESITYYIEKNLDDFYTKSSEHQNFSSSNNTNLNWVLAKNADWPDCIFKANYENINLKKEILNVQTLIRKGKAPNGWTVGPLSTPKNLGEILEKFGFSNVYQQAGMALDLKNLNKVEIKDTNLTIEKVDNEDSLNHWSKLVSEVFNLRVDFDFLKYLYSQEEAHFYIGKFEKKSVSTLMLCLSSGVAGLHAVSTLPGYRGKGFGFTISRKALIDALNMGYYISVLQASSMGEKVYRKLGFKKYCNIISYAID